MEKKQKELLQKIESKKSEIYNFCEKDELEKAEEAKKELDKLQAKYELVKDLEDESEEEEEGGGNGIKNYKNLEDTLRKRKEAEQEKIKNTFAKGIKASVGKAVLTKEDMEILNSMKEGTEEDGGLTVPKDIQTQIRELRRSEDALENLVNIEKVNKESGSRIIEELADQTPFENVEEEAEFPENATPKLKKIDYKVKKKGGILTATSELIEDSTENIIGYLIKWIAKKGKATRNFMIIKKIKEITAGKEKEIHTLDDLKDIFNVILDPTISAISVLVTNQDGYNWLDKLKDSDGKYLLQPDPTKPTQKLLFGQYPVHKIGNKTLKVENGTIPFIIGSLKEAITIFDRQKLSIEMSNVAGDLWKMDKIGIKVRERLDIVGVDSEAIIMAQVKTGAAPAEASIASTKITKK